VTPPALLLVAALLVTDGPPSSPSASSPSASSPSASSSSASSSSPSASSPSASPLPRVADAPGRWELAVVPRLTLNADEGIGLGARGVLYWHRFAQRPYKTALSFQAWATTKFVQQHYLRVDAIDAFGWPLRIESELGFFTTLTQPYCGLTAAAAFACPDDAVHQLRSTEPYLTAQGRLRVWRGPWFTETLKLEVFGGWRGVLYVPGTLFADDDGDGAPDLFPTPGTLYARQHPGGEPGFASVLQAGVVVDTRDNEPSPSRGFLVDASVRGAGAPTGSVWSFGGGNLTARLYAPLTTDRRVVVAQRLLVDGIVGDAPVRERMRTGGLVDGLGLGGQDGVRGVRLARFPGRLRAWHQLELRADVLHIDVLGGDLGLVVAGFVDGGVAVFDPDDEDDSDGAGGAAVAGGLPRLLVGGGGSLRVVWNTNFVFRIDLALSPSEPGRLGFYTAPNHPF
jgi:hypothetical protein